MAILKRHLVEKKTGPGLCDGYHWHPTVFYLRLKTFFDNGASAFGPPPRAEKQVEEREQRIAFLEAKLKRKDEVLAELREEHVALKKVLGKSEGPMGASRHARPGDRLRPSLERADGDHRVHVRSVAGAGDEQVLPLAGPLREGERAQPRGAPRFPTGGVGEASHHRVSRPLSAGRLPAADLYDAGSGCRRGPSWRARSMTCAACWLGTAGIDEGSGSGNHPGASAREVSLGRDRGSSLTTGRSSSPAISKSTSGSAGWPLSARRRFIRHRTGKSRGGTSPSSRNGCDRSALPARRGVAPSLHLRRSIQSGPTSQCDRLRGPARPAGRPLADDLGQARSQAGRGPKTAATPASAGLGGKERKGPSGRSDTVDRTKLKPPGETEAGSAGEQPCRGITRRTHRVDQVGSVHAVRLGAPTPRFFPQTSSNDRPRCLESSRRAAAELRSNVKSATVHFRLNQDRV